MLEKWIITFSDLWPCLTGTLRKLQPAEGSSAVRCPFCATSPGWKSMGASPLITPEPQKIFGPALAWKILENPGKSWKNPGKSQDSSILSFWIAWKILESYLERPLHLNMSYIQDTKHQFVGSSPMADWKVVHGNAQQPRAFQPLVDPAFLSFLKIDKDCCMKGVKVACLSLCMAKDQVHLTMSLCLCECVLRAHHLALWASL